MPDEMVTTVIPVPEPTYHTAWVECTNTDGKIVEWEPHRQHPSGEAFLAPGPARLVALTPLVSQHICDGRLRIVAEPEETLEEWLYRTGAHDDAAGDYRHIAKPKEKKQLPMPERLKATQAPAG
jgi:hypothetical protein